MKNINRFPIQLFTAAIALHCSSLAVAEIEEVIVTAQKRAQSTQDIPLAISAFSADEIKAMGAEDNNAIIMRTPGLTGGKDNDNQNILMIRGIGTQAFAPGTDSSVGTYFNEVPVSRANAVMGFMDIERVEVVKGPQGTLFGRNTASGAISVTNNPASLDEDSLDVTVAMGSESTQQYDVVANKVISDTFAGRIAIKHDERDGTYQSNEGEQLNDRNHDQYRISFQWQPSEDVNVKWFYDKYEFDYRWQPTSTDTTLLSELPLAVTDPWASTQDITVADLPKSSAENDLSVLQVSWDVSDDLVFSSNTGYFKSDSLGLSLNLDLSPFYLVSIHEEWQIEQKTQDFRLNGSSENTEWFIGASYYKETAAVTTFVHLDIDDNGQLNLGNEIDFTTDLIEKDPAKNVSESWAVYGDVTWELSDKTNLTFGARYTIDKKDGESENVAALFADDLFIFFPSPFQKLSDEWSSFDPRVAIDYSLNDEVLLYANVAKGYKAGGHNRFPLEPNQATVTSVDPEENTSYEFGVKADLLGGRARVNTAVFYSDYQDYQAEVNPPGATGAVIVNTGDLIAQGLEIDATFLVDSNTEMRFAYAYVDAEFQNGFANGVTLKGLSPSRAPENTFSGNVQHTIPMDSGELTTMLEYSWTDDINYTIFENTFTDLTSSDSYGLVNVRVGYSSHENWAIALIGTNITDEEYESSIIDFGIPFITPGMGSIWKLEGRYSF